MKDNIIKLILGTCLFIMGTGVGLSVKVFMERGVPVINGGGELLLLFTIPASVAVGFRLGINYIRKRNRKDKSKP